MHSPVKGVFSILYRVPECLCTVQSYDLGPSPPSLLSTPSYVVFLFPVLVGGRAGIFKQSMGARNRGGIWYRTGPQGYIGLRIRNSFLGINSWAP